MSDDFCGCDSEDRPSVYEDRDVMSARKPHECTECGRAILPGESYNHIWGVWPTIDGAATFRTCARCMALKEFVLAHVPCACLYLGQLVDGVHDELDMGRPETDVLVPDVQTLIADIEAQPKWTSHEEFKAHE